MSNAKLQFGIIGTGAIAGHHITSIQKIPDCEVVALASSTAERAKAAEAQFGIKAYSDYQEMFQQETLDVVCVLTKSGNHLEPTLAAAQSGVHVITEKPLEVNLDRADQMIEACKKAKVHLACIFQNRFTQAFQDLKLAVSQGKLGRLILGNAYIKWYRNESYYQSSDWKGTIDGDGGAALINQGIHTIDLLLDIMGPVANVSAKVRTKVHQIEGEDLGLALLEFESGALGSIQASTAAYPGYPERLEVFGERGSIILEGGKIHSWNIMGEDAKEASITIASGAADPMAIDYQLHLKQITQIVNDIRQNRSHPIDGTAARKSLSLIQAIYQSSKLGKQVKLV